MLYVAVVLPTKTIMERRKRGAEPGPVAPTQVELLVEIRDLLHAQDGRGGQSVPQCGGRSSR